MTCPETEGVNQTETIENRAVQTSAAQIRIYSARPEERPLYEAAAEKAGLRAVFSSAALTPEEAERQDGSSGVIVLTTNRITAETAEAFVRGGIRFAATRSAGYDHIDLIGAARAGLRIANVPYYAPESIAEHTIFLAMALLRKAKRESRMVEAYDFSLKGLQGRQLCGMTAGVIGTGHIGRATIRILNAFGCHVFAFARHPQEGIGCTYAPLADVISGSDILFLHCPLTEETKDMIGEAALASMKRGAYLVNTARGGLVDSRAVLAALKEGQLAGFAMDVYDGEKAFLRKNAGEDGVSDPVFRELLEREDVYYTAHMAFDTEEALRAMIGTAVEDLRAFLTVGACRNEIRQ